MVHVGYVIVDNTAKTVVYLGWVEKSASFYYTYLNPRIFKEEGEINTTLDSIKKEEIPVISELVKINLASLEVKKIYLD